MNKNLVLAIARRDEKARAAIRAVNQVRRLIRRGRKVAREIDKLSKGGK